jgi:hypothetical protein
MLNRSYQGSMTSAQHFLNIAMPCYAETASAGAGGFTKGGGGPAKWRSAVSAGGAEPAGLLKADDAYECNNSVQMPHVPLCPLQWLAMKQVEQRCRAQYIATTLRACALPPVTQMPEVEAKWREAGWQRSVVIGKGGLLGRDKAMKKQAAIVNLQKSWA